MKLTVNKIQNVISGIIGSEKYSVPFSQETFNTLQKLEASLDDATSLEEVNTILKDAKEFTSRDFKSKIEEAAPNIMYDKEKNSYYLRQNNVVSKYRIPKVLADKITKAYEESLPIEPMVRAWVHFLRNPNFNPTKAEFFATYLTTTVGDQKDYAKFIGLGYSSEVAEQMSTYNDISLTKNGLLSTYKYVRVKDWKFDEHGAQIDRWMKVYDPETGAYSIPDAPIAGTTPLEEWPLLPPVMGESGDPCIVSGFERPTHFVKVGAIHSLPDWSYVDCDDRRSCVKGLHVGGLQYIEGYGGKTSLLLNTFVNPMNIGAFDHSGSGAIRALEYFVHSANFAPNKNFYNESNYLSHTEAAWAEMRKQAIEVSENKIKQIKEQQDQINAF